jgi:hypothetical protein
VGLRAQSVKRERRVAPTQLVRALAVTELDRRELLEDHREVVDFGVAADDPRALRAVDAAARAELSGRGVEVSEVQDLPWAASSSSATRRQRLGPPADRPLTPARRQAL